MSLLKDDDDKGTFLEEPLCTYTGHTADILDLSWSKVRINIRDINNNNFLIYRISFFSPLRWIKLSGEPFIIYLFILDFFFMLVDCGIYQEQSASAVFNMLIL